MLWNLTLQCLRFMGDYWLMHMRPDITESFVLALDNGVNSLVESTIGFSLGNLTPFANERLRLPVRLKGMGLRQAADHRYAQFVGGMSQGVMHLLDRVDSEGNTVFGRYNTPAITTFHCNPSSPPDAPASGSRVQSLFRE